MGSSEVRNRRLEQVEQMLASSLTVKEWCKLNKVAESHHTQLAASACKRASGAILDAGCDVLDDEMANNEAEESGQSS